MRDPVVSEISNIGGLAEMEQTAVAVMPTGVPSSDEVMMVTPEAKCPMVSRKACAATVSRDFS